MPSYAYICEVCSSQVTEGNEHCPLCGCPAIKNSNELNWFKQEWETSDKSTPIVHVGRKKITSCKYTSIGVFLTGIWYYFIAPTKGNMDDLYFVFIAVSIAFPLSIIGFINGVLRLRKERKEGKTNNSAVACIAFSSIALLILAIPAYIFTLLFLKMF